jgi:hypothetical protein
VLLAGGTALTPALSVTDCDAVTIERLSIVSALGDGVFVAESDEITLSRVTVEGAAGDAFVGGESEDIVMDRCRVEDAGGDAIAWFLADDVSVIRCVVSGAGGHGIRLDDVHGGLVERCHVTGASQNGIDLGFGDPSTGCSAVRNVVLAPGVHGIGLRGTDNSALDNRVVTANGAGVLVQLGSTGGIIDGNRLIGCEDGITLSGTGFLVRDNRVVKALLNGINCQGQQAVLVDNRVQHCGVDAFFVADSMSGGALIGCRALQAGAEGFELAGDGLAVTGNVSVGADGTGFALTGTAIILAGNSSKGSGAAEVLDAQGGNTYLGNSFEPSP